MKIGDIVICRGEQDELNINNQIGTVLGWHKNTGNILVRFDKPFSVRLHYGFEHAVDENKKTVEDSNVSQCWYCAEELVSAFDDFNIDL
jgi:hypothetical protein